MGRKIEAQEQLAAPSENSLEPRKMADKKADRNADHKAENKNQWREKIRVRLNEFIAHQGGIGAAAYLDKLQRLMTHLKDFLAQEHGEWGGFCGLADEPNLVDLYHHTDHLEWAFPRCTGTELHFFRPAEVTFGEDPTQGFGRNRWGILEPNPHQSIEIPLSQLTGILVPARAFNQEGVRLGRGKGFYDRALANFRGQKIGVAFSVQVISGDLPKEEHDCRVDRIITEEGVILCH